MSEYSQKSSEISKMSAVEFVQFGLQQRIAPPSIGSVKARVRHASNVLALRRWSRNRVKDAWYADPRISINADEIRDIEALTGLQYGRAEVRDLDELIRKADALLDGQDTEFVRPFVDAMRSFFRSVAGTGASGRRGLSNSDGGAL